MCAHLSSHRKGYFPSVLTMAKPTNELCAGSQFYEASKTFNTQRVCWSRDVTCFLRNSDNKSLVTCAPRLKLEHLQNSAPNNSPWQRFNANILGEYEKKNTFLTSHLASSGCRMQYIWSCSLVIVFAGLSLVHTGARKCLPLKLQKESNRFQWPWRENKKRIQIFRNRPLKSSTQHRLPHLHLQRLKHKRPQEYHEHGYAEESKLT